MDRLISEGGKRDLKRRDALMNIKIIPNVRRIKVEKVAVAKELLSKQGD